MAEGEPQYGLQDGGPPIGGRLIHGTRLFEAFLDGGCRAFDAGSGRMLWSEWDPEPRFYPSPHKLRRIQLWPDMARIWVDASGGIVSCLGRDGSGVKVVARRSADGTTLWTRSLEYRPRMPTDDDLSLEDITACLVVEPTALVVAIERSRPGGTEFTAQGVRVVEALAPCLELTRLDPATGEIQWRVEHAHTGIGLARHDDFDGLHAADGAFRTFDWETGEVRVLLLVDAQVLAAPRVIAGRVVCCWHGRGMLHIDALDPESGTVVAGGELKCRAPGALFLWAAGRRAVVNLYRDRYVLLGNDFRPLGQVVIPGGFKHVWEQEDGTFALATANGLAKLDGASGAILSFDRVRKQ